MTSYPHLLSPVEIGPVRLPTRIVSTAHQTGLVHDHVPTPDLAAYLEERAAGGAGAVWVEATAVHPTGLLTPHTVGGYLPQVVDGLAEVASAVHRHGSRLFIQLFHGGREQIASPPRPAAVAPSAVPTPRYHVEPRALTRPEIDELLAGYAASARHARDAGLDGIEISASHGYLPAQFLGTRTNRRSDEYNGNLTARLRFLAEALARIRGEVGDGMAVGVRLAADELGPQGMDGERCRDVILAVADQPGIDFVSLVVGDSSTYAGSTYIAPPPPVASAAIFDHIVGIRDILPSRVSLIATTRVVDPAEAEMALGGGLADAVGMTRALIADPLLVRKAAEGREDDAIPCIGCNQACIGHYHVGVPIGCVVNVRTGRERVLGARPPARSDRVLVVGAGPAGVSAAIEAADGGAQVSLVERDDDIGGQLRLAGRTPAHREIWERWSAYARRRLTHQAIDLRLSTRATPELLDEDYDAVVLATGAYPYLQPTQIPPGVRVTDAWQVISAPESVDGPVLVADWGGEWTGLDAAEVLAAAGLAVTVAYASAAPGEGVHQYQRNLQLERLDHLGVVLWPHLEIALDGADLRLRNIFSGRTVAPPARVATLVLAQGRCPTEDLWPYIEGRVGAVRVGDVFGPRGLEEAVLEGSLAGRGERLHSGAELRRRPERRGFADAAARRFEGGMT